jgi:hypothetical protein
MEGMDGKGKSFDLLRKLNNETECTTSWTFAKIHLID